MCFKLTLGNYAESSEGAVYIENLKIEPELISTSEIDPELSKIFSINGYPVDLCDTSFCFRSDECSVETFHFSFRHDAIKFIFDDVATIICYISFDYLKTDEILDEEKISSMLKNGQFETFSYTVTFNIEKNPGAHWLAIDFGTSAIVAKFADEIDRFGDVHLLDLQKALKAYSDLEEYTKDEIEEFGTPFLSSTMYLRAKGTVNTDNYEEDILRISPPQSLLSQNIEYIIPYLKALIGMDEVPNFDRNLDEYTYKENPDDTEFVKFAKNPLTVETILSNAYRILLRNYIGKNLEEEGEKDKLNKLIITVPNTFTPRHAEQIRTAILTDPVLKYENFREEYILFLAESDAVACYYISQRYNINKDRPNREEILSQPEYVLVYDMGAGTLDITYLRIDHDEDSDDTNVKIIGRLGKATAGNYLDFEIAQFLNEKYGKLFAQRIFGGKTDPATIDFQHKLRNFIRNEIKPFLDKDKDIFFSKDHFGFVPDFTDDGLTITTKEICDNHYIQDFLRRNTEEIFENFFSLYKVIDNEVYEKGKFPIHTVILSGRSVQLEILKERIKKQIVEWADPLSTHEVYYPYIGETNTLKSAVVQGALQYALLYRERETSPVKIESPNLQARYGVLYKDTKNLWVFKELFNPSTRPLNENKPHIKDGMTIYEYDSNIYNADGKVRKEEERPTIDITNTPKVYFVQSYSANTAKDMNEENTEYITRIWDFNRNEITASRRKNVPVSITVDEDGEMRLLYDEFRDDPRHPLKMNLDELSNTFRRSMWPYLD